VLAAIELLNYRPTQPAGRAARRHRSIAVLIKEHDNPYYAEVVAGVRAHAEGQGYTLLVVSSEGEYDVERRAVELLRDKEVDGLIVTPVFDEHADLSHFFELKRRNFPLVLLEQIRGLRSSLVDVDNVEASRTAVEHLIALGHTRVAHLAGPDYSMHSRERVDGVRRAYSGTRHIFTDDVIVPTGAHLADGYRAGLALFGGADGERPAAERPTAVTCYNDLVAVGLLRALAELGLRVPHDVSVVGFDDLPLCEYLPVPLTTVQVPKFKMGESAAQLLVRHIESRQAVAPQKISLTATLVVRGSTAAPAAVAAPSSMPPALGLSVTAVSAERLDALRDPRLDSRLEARLESRLEARLDERNPTTAPATRGA
jgi:LacI family transcriptional regulator/LacI family repressor for deo operon, udp, cdd, tsx, nupC, and nupG